MVPAAVLMSAGILAALADSAAMALVLIAIVLFGFQSWIGNVQTMPSDIFPAEVVASVAGLGGLGAGAGAILFTLATGFIVDRFGSYTPVLAAAGVLPVLATATLFAVGGPIRRVSFDAAWTGSAGRSGPRNFNDATDADDSEGSAKMKNYLDLTGKVALITGASSGIGAAAATVMSDLGAKVAVGYHRNKDGAEQVCASIASGRRRRAGDSGRRASRARRSARWSTQVTDTLGPIDILVNNAGSLVGRQQISETTEDRLDDILALNLKSAVLCAQVVAPSMVARKRGAIVNVASIAGRNGGGPGAGAYAAAKGGLITFTKSMAKELAPHGVRVNAVSPGVIDTPFHEAFSTPEMLRNFVAQIPLGRIGKPSECATVIAFLASDAASFIIGETIEVNGGQLML